MLTSTIQSTKLDTSTVDYELISQVGMKSVRSVAGRELDQPKEMSVSHETNKSKTHTNTAVIFDEVDDVGTTELPELGKARAMIKISYDHSVSAQVIRDLVAELKSVLDDSTVVKLLNRES